MSIKDEYSSMNISRQRKWQLRNAAKGLCVKCKEPRLEGFAHCEAHHLAVLKKDKRSANTRFNRLKGTA